MQTSEASMNEGGGMAGGQGLLAPGGLPNSVPMSTGSNPAQQPPLMNNPADGAQQFCLRWNSYPATVATQLATLRAAEDFVDVTLACDGRQLRAHKLVLSACSPYFMQLFKSTPCQHPVIFLRDVGFRQLTALLEFMYAGEVNVSQIELPALLRTAEALQVRGLADTTANNNNSSTAPPPQMQKNNFTPQYPTPPSLGQPGQSVIPPQQPQPMHQMHQPQQMMDQHQVQQQTQHSQQQQQQITQQNQSTNVPTTHCPTTVPSVNEDAIGSSVVGGGGGGAVNDVSNSQTPVSGASSIGQPPPNKRTRKEDLNMKQEDSDTNDSGEFEIDQSHIKNYINDTDETMENLDEDLFPGTRDPLDINQGELGSQSEEESSEGEEEDEDDDDEGLAEVGGDGSGLGIPGANGESVAGPSTPMAPGAEAGEVGKLKEEGAVPTGTARSRLSRSLWPPGIPYHGPQQCPYCPRVLSNVGNWRKHVLTMHFAREKVYKCQHCESAFRTAEYLQKHYVRVHNYPQKMTRRKYTEQT